MTQATRVRVDTIEVRLALRCLLHHCPERWPLELFWDAAAGDNDIGRAQRCTATLNGSVRQLRMSGRFTYRDTLASSTQQVYAASSFGTAECITGIAFRSTPGSRHGAAYDNVSISLSTTSFADEAGTPLSGIFVNNSSADA